MVKIKKRLKHNNNNHYKGKNKKLYITVHQTGNKDKGADAEMHARFIENGSKSTWHYTVDDKEAIQHFDHDTQCWHAGDGDGNGNLHSIGIEACINSDGDYVATIKNTAELVKKLMQDLSVPLSRVVQHNHWSGKDCPKQIRDNVEGISWNDFKKMIQNKKVAAAPAASNEKSIDQLVAEVNAGKHGNGEERKKSLGSRYEEVQDAINGGSKPKEKTVKQLAAEVNAGKHGDGEERKKSLGSRYKEVQAYINKQYS